MLNYFGYALEDFVMDMGVSSARWSCRRRYLPLVTRFDDMEHTNKLLDASSTI